MERLSRGRAQRIAANKEKILKMAPKCHPGGSKIAPRSLENGSRRPPKSGIDNWILFCSFCSPLGRLLGRSWVALGRSWRCLCASWAAPGRSRGAPGRRFGFPGASFGSSLGLFFRRLWKNTKFFKTLVFSMVFDGFGVPGGSKIDPRWLPKSLLGASWRLLALSWRLSRRCLGVSCRPLGASWGLLGVSWAALGPKRRTKQKPGNHGTGSALEARAASTASG